MKKVSFEDWRENCKFRSMALFIYDNELIDCAHPELMQCEEEKCPTYNELEDNDEQ